MALDKHILFMSLINNPSYIFVFPRSKDLFIPLQKNIFL